MRRFAAVLALVAVSQSVLLGTRILCDGAMPASEAMPDMPGMDMSGMPAPDTPARSDRDRHHAGAHCPLMATCLAPAIRSASTAATTVELPHGRISNVRVESPRSEKAAPEPPPPKR